MKCRKHGSPSKGGSATGENEAPEKAEVTPESVREVNGRRKPEGCELGAFIIFGPLLPQICFGTLFFPSYICSLSIKPGFGKNAFFLSGFY